MQRHAVATPLFCIAMLTTLSAARLLLSLPVPSSGLAPAGATLTGTSTLEQTMTMQLTYLTRHFSSMTTQKTLSSTAAAAEQQRAAETPAARVALLAAAAQVEPVPPGNATANLLLLVAVLRMAGNGPAAVKQQKESHRTAGAGN
jgi:hypothetical protein